MEIGIDVSKAWLDVAVLEMYETFQIGYDKVGSGELIARQNVHKVHVIDLEPSGG